MLSEIETVQDPSSRCAKIEIPEHNNRELHMKWT